MCKYSYIVDLFTKHIGTVDTKKIVVMPKKSKFWLNHFNYHRFLNFLNRASVSSEAVEAADAAPDTAELRPLERPFPVNSLSRLVDAKAEEP